MLSTWHPAPSALAGVLAGIWSVHAARDADLSARVLPDGTTCLAFQRYGTVLRSCDNAWSPWARTCVSGPRTGSFDFTLDADGWILIVQLLPAGAMQALGVPMSSLTDRFEPLDAVVGSVSQRVSDCVLSDADDLSCVRAIERWLLERIRTEHTRCDVTDAVLQEVASRAGNVRVDDLARQVNLSRRHLGRIMHERVGMSPKLFGRITRFDRAVQLARLRPMVPWARVALDIGYADQAHLSREFVELGGIRPSELRGASATMIW